jgi:hypothetical protein
MNKTFKRYMAAALSFSIVMMCVGRSSAMLAPVSGSVQSASLQRGTDMKTVQTFLEQKQVRDRLVTFGMSDGEIQSRLGTMSDADLHQVATHIDKEYPAADGGGVLVTVLVLGILVLLFVYLLKRV